MIGVPPDKNRSRDSARLINSHDMLHRLCLDFGFAFKIFKIKMPKNKLMKDTTKTMQKKKKMLGIHE